MGSKQKPSCEFGAKCYRKNPKHFETYSHPKELPDERKTVLEAKPPAPKKPKLEKPAKDFDGNERKKQVKMKQTTLQFIKKDESLKQVVPHSKDKLLDQKERRLSPRKLVQKDEINKEKNRKGLTTGQSQRKGRTHRIVKRETTTSPKKGFHSICHEDIKEDEDQNNSNQSTDNKMQDSNSPERSDKTIIPESEDENSSDSNEVKDVQSTSWVFIKRDSNTTTTTKPTTEDLTGKSVEEIIKILFLVDMPQDFYSFFDFCKSIDNDEPSDALKLCGLKLVGPFDILQGKTNYPADKKLSLCHWRFYYDPPEFQTVLASESEFHIGYWRDDPKEPPVFLASNNSDKDCIFKVEAENIFGFVHHYLLDFVKTCDPFTKVKVKKFQTILSDWAEKKNFSLEKKTPNMTSRQKKVVSKTFHKAGIVVPVEAKTELGYRPLIETDANLKRICKVIMEAEDSSEREALFENLQPLITAANIANDECDFGNSLELGIDLFCMGSALFHDTIEHLLTTAYSLLNRTEFEEIIRVHLKNRRKGKNMSVF